MPKITVALSVYNVSSYIRGAVDSILSQTFKDFELLCIDDASTDETYAILQEYALKESRIRLFRQEYNQGLSVSRNLAIQEALGEYIVMIDGDDLFSNTMLEVAYMRAIETNADMVLWDYIPFSEESEIHTLCNKPSSLLSVTPHDKIQLIRRPAFSATRMTKLSVLRDLNICFPKGMTKQDIPVHWKLVTNLERIELIPEYFLYYRQQPNSTSSKKGRSVFSLAYVMDITKQQLEEDGLYSIYKDEFLRSRLSLLFGMYDYVLPELKSEALTILNRRLGNDEYDYIENSQNELTGCVRDFYNMLMGSWISKVKYNSFMFLRTAYRKLVK